MYYDIKNREIFNDRNKIFVKNLVFYRDQYYNKGTILKKDELFLVALTSKNFLELYQVMKKILSQDDLNKFMKDVINMSKNEFVLHAWAKEELDKLVEEKKRELYEKEKKEHEKEKERYEKEKEQYEKEKERYEKEKKQYDKEKKQYEREKTQYENEIAIYKNERNKHMEDIFRVIQSLLSKGMSYDDVSDIIGKSINEIKEIEKSFDR